MSEERHVAINTADLWPDDADEDEGVVTNWFISEGTTVDKGDTLGEIQIEKVSLDIIAPVTGTVSRVVCAEDDEFERGDKLVSIDPE